MIDVDRIRREHARRHASGESDRLGPLSPSGYMAQQEKERAFIRCIKAAGLTPLYDRRVLEIGCGTGDNLLEFLRLGFLADRMVGNELLEENLQVSRMRLPAAIQLYMGDAADIDLPRESFDVVLQSTVLSSVLEDAAQRRIADRMWDLTKPGGGILWYDFTYNNPRNPRVRGVPVWRVRQLFPMAELKVWRITLAPPISRRVTRIHPALYTAFNSVPLLRTHVLCWIQKPATPD